MTNVEQIDLSINLSSSYWQDPPKTRIFVNDNLLFEGIVSEPKNINWTGNLVEGSHKLIIELYDKNKYQTVLENNQIVKDQLLNIDSISFDEIDISYLKHSLSNYYPNKEENANVPLLVKNCVNLGWNGRWELEFSTPIYIWLLENI